jgi:hypothetical protein
LDPKVFRAAVSAAIRVTISTALVGCGNTASTSAVPSDGGGSASAADSGGNGSGGVPSGTGAEQSGTAHATAGSAPISGTSAVTPSGGQPSATTPEVGGSASGSANVGGGTNVGGSSSAGGETFGAAGEAGAPAQLCGAEVAECLSVLETFEAGAALDEAGLACCLGVREGLSELQKVAAECYRDLNRRFTGTAARSECCKDSSTWTEIACAPWGPPVPPELSAELLESWANVA